MADDASPVESIVTAATAGSANAPAPSDWTPPWQPPFLDSFTSGIPTPEKVQKFEKDQSERLTAKLGNEGLIESQRERDDALNQEVMRRKYNQVAASTEDLKPWNPQTMAPQGTSLWEKLGSPGFIFAMLGSSFSAMPMDAAMNSGAAAINAINQGEMDAYNRAFDEWKVNSNLAIQRHNLEQSEFEDIAKIGDRKDASYRSKLEMLALKYNDESTLALLHAGMDKEAMDAREARNKAMEEYTKVVPAMMEQHALITGVQEKVKAGVPYPKAFNDTVAELETAKHAGIWSARGGANAVATQQAMDVANDLQTVVGHDLSPELRAAVVTGIGAKGSNSAKIGSAVAKAIASIKADIGDGKEVSDADMIGRINNAVAGASTSGRSASALFTQKFVQEHQDDHGGKGATAKELMAATARYSEMLSGARSLGTRMTAIGASIKEVEEFAPKVIEARKKFGGGDLTPLNNWEQVVAAATGKPGFGRLAVYTAGMLTAYAKTLSRTGTTTVEAQRRAMDLLNPAYSTATFEERVNTMVEEMGIAKHAVKGYEKELMSSDDDEDDTVGFSIVR